MSVTRVQIVGNVSTGASFAGVITATSFSGDGSGLTGVGVGTADSINTSGIITASAVSANEFIGAGDKLIFSPTVTSFSPADGATGVSALSSPNISITYNQQVGLGTTGAITLRTVSAGGTIVESYDVTSSGRLTFSTSTLTIDPTSNLGVGVTHFVVVPNNAVAGYTGINTYSFTSIFQAFSSINPANGATAIGVGTNITLTFLATPVRGTGTITLRSGSVGAGGSTIETFDAASSGQISISGNNYIIDPTSNLGFSTSIHTIIPSTAIQNYVGLNTTGADTHSFTTDSPALGSSYEGGFLICKASPLRWVVSPRSAEVSRSWYLRNDANTRSQAVSGCTGWFVPTRPQLQNPGYCCRSFWGPSPCYSSAAYWSSTEPGSPFIHACFMNFGDGGSSVHNKTNTYCVRAFRCVTY